VEIDFYHHGIFLPVEIFFYNFNVLQAGEIKINKEAQCNGIKIYEIL